MTPLRTYRDYTPLNRIPVQVQRTEKRPGDLVLDSSTPPVRKVGVGR